MLIPTHRAALYSVTALTVATGIVFFVLLVIQCSPVSYFWTRMRGDTEGECGYIDAIAIMLYIFSATSALFDLLVGLLPILLVRKLQMDWRTKAAVAGLLGMAYVYVYLPCCFYCKLKEPVPALQSSSGSLSSQQFAIQIFSVCPLHIPKSVLN